MEPTDTERGSIRDYCAGHHEMAAALKPVQKDRSAAQRRKKDIKNEMQEYMVEKSLTCCEVRIAGVIHYIRRKRVRRTQSITETLVFDALQNLDREDIVYEATTAASTRESVINAILNKIKDVRQNDGETVELSKHSERGVVIMAADNTLTSHITEYYAEAAKLKDKNSELSSIKAEYNQRITDCESSIAAFMDRLNLSSQRVNVNRDNDYVQTYYIRKKKSIRKSRLTEKVVKDLVTQVIREHVTESASVDDFMQSRQDIAVAIVKHINLLPATETVKLSLDRGAMKRKREEE